MGRAEGANPVLLEGVDRLRYPSPQDFKAFFRRMPRWAIAVILVLLFARFLIVGLWHLFCR